MFDCTTVLCKTCKNVVSNDTIHYQLKQGKVLHCIKTVSMTTF